MNPAQLEDVWRAVEAPAVTGGLAGRPASPSGSGPGAILALDTTGLRHLLIPADASDEPPARATTKGLVITIDELRVEDRDPRRYYDIACRDAALHANFTAVAGEILEALGGERDDIRVTLERVLARWRWFWESPPEGLTDTEVVGLFGELWFLEFWLDPVDATALGAWTGPHRDRHDFKWAAASVEVKATRARGDGAATHRITTLDQLEDPEQGQLYLFSMRAVSDPIAAHSLSASIERLRGTLSGRPELLRVLDERLALSGCSPVHHHRYDAPLRVTAEELYRVDSDFPRLTHASFVGGSVPTGVDGIGYSLDLMACARWRVATAPGAESRRLRESMAV